MRCCRVTGNEGWHRSSAGTENSSAVAGPVPGRPVPVWPLAEGGCSNVRTCSTCWASSRCFNDGTRVSFLNPVLCCLRWLPGTHCRPFRHVRDVALCLKQLPCDSDEPLLEGTWMQYTCSLYLEMLTAANFLFCCCLAAGGLRSSSATWSPRALSKPLSQERRGDTG